MSKYLFIATAQGLATFEWKEDDDWTKQAHNLSDHRFTCVTARAGTILAGTTEGLFRSDDAGGQWQPANEGLEIQHLRWLTYHPTTAGLAFAGTEPAGIFVSHDDGQTWQARPEVAELRAEHEWNLPYSPEAGCVRGFAFHGDRGYAAVEQGGLLRSDDSGESWYLVEGSSGDPEATPPEVALHPDVHSVAVHPTSANLVFAATGGGLYRSGDGGRSWEHLYNCYCRALWVNSENADHIVFGPADAVDRNGRIEETHDGGQTWEPATRNLPETPWPERMPERFVEVNDRLFAVLSDGRLLTTPAVALVWRHGLPNIEQIAALSPMLD